MKSIHHFRKDYESPPLRLRELDANPFIQFSHWLSEAIESDVVEPNAVALASCTHSGQPSVRMVLLKYFSEEEGFIIFTNLESRKGKELIDNPKASLLFYWDIMARQIRIEGKVKKVERVRSQEYFNQRPRKSRISAWASSQSRRIDSREALESQCAYFEDRFKDCKDIPVPDFWGGFAIKPHSFEFWQGRENRLHDRIAYEKNEKSWLRFRLSS